MALLFFVCKTAKECGQKQETMSSLLTDAAKKATDAVKKRSRKKTVLELK